MKVMGCLVLMINVAKVSDESDESSVSLDDDDDNPLHDVSTTCPLSMVSTALF